MTQKSKSDRNLVKMKMALAAGGLMATMIGAGLLGQEASTLTTNTTTITQQSAVTTNSGTSSTTNIDASIPAGLDLNLESIPTVAAPTFRSNNSSSNSSSMLSMPVARGRSSG